MKSLLSVSVLALLAGCASQPSSYDQEVKQQLTEINTSLKEMVKKTRMSNIKVDMAAPYTPKEIEFLAELKPLPEQPTAAQVKEYAASLYAMAKARQQLSSTDAFAMAVKAIPPGFLLELAPYLNNYYFSSCLVNWLTPADKAVILQKLPDEPNLLKCVEYIPYDYAELRGPLFKMLQNNDKSLRGIPAPYADLLASDPEYKDQVESLLCQRSNLYSLAGAFAKRDKNDMIYEKLWIAYPVNQQKIPYALILKMLATGKPDAIAVLIDQLKKEQNFSDYYRCSLTEIFPEFPPDATVDWFVTNQNFLKFSPNDKKFYLQK